MSRRSHDDDDDDAVAAAVGLVSTPPPSLLLPLLHGGRLVGGRRSGARIDEAADVEHGDGRGEVWRRSGGEIDGVSPAPPRPPSPPPSDGRRHRRHRRRRQLFSVQVLDVSLGPPQALQQTSGRPTEVGRRHRDTMAHSRKS